MLFVHNLILINPFQLFYLNLNAIQSIEKLVDFIEKKFLGRQNIFLATTVSRRLFY